MAGRRLSLAGVEGMDFWDGCTGGDYVLALKGNQGTLHDDVRRFLNDPQSGAPTTAAFVDGDHGRIEPRTATLSTDIAWLQQDHQWP
jgi:hypothetical protein